MAAASPEPVANAAAVRVDQWVAAFNRHDWDAVVALFAPGAIMSDRRPFAQVEGSDAVEVFRFLIDLPDSRYERRELVATRGDHLALNRSTFAFSDGAGGQSEVDVLVVLEVDASTRLSMFVTFDSAQLDAAYSELDRRYRLATRR